ncbi:MraY family glycosyltransferase [Thermotoga sp. 38H-to]|uniref:glycosyltransferase family 4 protein n=1 Tax=Thermotoga sp. 38H-to TaxID=1755812 RepID=UPI0013ED14CA|nr:MraY family glycosyltransferase [Thermotoga sp. 38H-to]KAF2959719.1 glycosyltransferase [Thermotoga sp. 38H-to]
MAFLLSFLLSLFGVWFFGRVAKRLNIVDRPDGVLKPHGRETPYLGGLGIFVGVLPFLWNDTVVLLSASIALTLGLMDDLFSISPFLRLVAEFGISLLLVWRFIGLENLLVSTLWLFFIAVLVNSVNMMDGMDGLCGSLVALSSLSYFFLVRGVFFENLSLSLLGASLGYLVFNFPPAKIFMGDAGSYLLAVLLSTIVLSQNRFFSFNTFLTMVFPLWIFFLDFLASVVRRYRNRRSIFKGDRDHMYDKLSRRSGTRRALFIMIATHAVFCGFSFGALGNIVMSVVTLVLAAVFSFVLIKSLGLLHYD